LEKAYKGSKKFIGALQRVLKFQAGKLEKTKAA